MPAEVSFVTALPVDDNNHKQLENMFFSLVLYVAELYELKSVLLSVLTELTLTIQKISNLGLLGIFILFLIMDLVS